MKKRSLLWLLAISICAVFIIPMPASALPEAELPLSAESAILMDASDGSVLYEKNAHARKGMASTTKIMTALVAAQSMPLDKSILIPKEAVGIEGSSVYLTEGESLTVRQLLYALLLSSANDAATALAIASAGSVEVFAEKMNLFAKELGLSDTHFINPHGLYHEDHYTTAFELALITAEALRNTTVKEIVSTYKTYIPLGNAKKGRLLVNHNKLLKLYDGAIGVKTGFTKKTGRCLVSAAERDGLTLIAVTLNAPDDWNDHIKMLDHGFDNYESVTLFEAGEFRYPLKIMGGKEAYVVLSNKEDISMTLPKNRGKIKYTVLADRRIEFAPIYQGTVYGSIVFTADDRCVESPLVSAYDVPVATKQKKNIFEMIFSFLSGLFT